MSNLVNNETKRKIQYQPPKLMWLGEVESASGICVPGSTPGVNSCTVGPGAGIAGCLSGEYASVECSVGAHQGSAYDPLF